jgi:WD40 repeat protein
MKLFRHIQSPILCLTFTPDGASLLATAQRCRTVGIWDLPEGKFQRWHPWADTSVRSLAFSADGTYLAVGNQWGMVLPYFWAKDNYNSECHAHAPVDALAFAPDRPLLAVAAYQVTLWGLHDDGVWGAALGGDDNYRAVAFAPDGKKVAGTRYSTGWLEVWPLQGGQPLPDDPTCFELPRPSSALAFAPDGQTLAVASGPEVLLYDVVAGRERSRLHGHTGQVRHLAYHPAGRLLASAGWDETVRLWDVEQQREVRSFNGDIGKVRCLAFAPDGMTCAAGGQSGQVVLWDVDD